MNGNDKNEWSSNKMNVSYINSWKQKAEERQNKKSCKTKSQAIVLFPGGVFMKL